MRQYIYRLTPRGIDYVMTHCVNVPDNATFGDTWAIYRRHDSKQSPFNFELWLNDTIFINRWTAKAMRRWRRMVYIVPYTDAYSKHNDRYVVLKRILVTKELEDTKRSK